MKEGHLQTVRSRRAQDIWRRHLRSYTQLAVGRYPSRCCIVRVTPTGQILRFVRGMGVAQ
jgi:hypothetical protein